MDMSLVGYNTGKNTIQVLSRFLYIFSKARFVKLKSL